MLAGLSCRDKIQILYPFIFQNTNGLLGDGHNYVKLCKKTHYLSACLILCSQSPIRSLVAHRLRTADLSNEIQNELTEFKANKVKKRNKNNRTR